MIQWLPERGLRQCFGEAPSLLLEFAHSPFILLFVFSLVLSDLFQYTHLDEKSAGFMHSRHFSDFGNR